MRLGDANPMSSSIDEAFKLVGIVASASYLRQGQQLISNFSRAVKFTLLGHSGHWVFSRGQAAMGRLPVARLGPVSYVPFLIKVRSWHQIQFVVPSRKSRWLLQCCC